MAAFAADPAPDVRLFAIAPPTLRANANSTQERAQPPLSSLSPVELSVSREMPLDLLTQRYEAMTGTPLLVRAPTPEEPGGAYGYVKTRILDPITDLESVKVGKVHLTGSVVNAIKRKNPLCLLNPFIFAVDW